MSRRTPRVVVTNDDGPPTDLSGHSPFVYPFACALAEQLGWDVKVVVPSSQRSWVGKSYAITQVTTGRYFYPTGPNGTDGEQCELPRPLKEGEKTEWVLLDGTPATCANIAIHSLYPPGSIDLVISGPNFGRNTSTAFALSSGTIGAAMAASLSHIPAIALSWGLMEGYKPPPQSFIQGAVDVSCQIASKLWDLGWEQADSEHRVDVYSVNVPLMPSIISKGGPTVYWTEMAKTKYQRLFKSTAKIPAPVVKDGGPAAVPADKSSVEQGKEQEAAEGQASGAEALRMVDSHYQAPLRFVFAPDIGPLVNPSPASLQEGTDNHALMHGAISVTPIQAAFASADFPRGKAIETDGLKWRL
ncbi:BZ3500_MvSof-1268-A1-R1_Chr1-3g01966 [Microbotryum saponariae]|uniref:BZ3500_MvSof-1268-A1-R1_Chr1-3g01966 protein n=1 Tax=Microbotryum saponariae TaxID=289078 RepID=A0A2X0KMQ1_9BASI|nr:BZ3500_MvSof-1268-A1-R1_Chr1-3g01966 [Microbotryum saponariae]SCZ95042.1 BZ3501_MvSof-1269-A2-R1_Chr1-3g01568 [Microbotryum saponariae]